MDSTGSTESSNNNPSEIDYHHGADEVARIVRENLMRQIVSVVFDRQQVYIDIGKNRITVLIDKNLTSENCIKFVNGGGRVVGLITNVGTPE